MRVTNILGSAAGLLTAFIAPAIASAEYYREVKAGPLNVRTGPGRSNRVIRTLKKGTRVLVTRKQGAWSHIRQPRWGWVNSAFLQPRYRYVKVDNLNLRAGPTTQSRSIRLLKKGTRVQVRKFGKAWAKLDGRFKGRWVLKRHLSRHKPGRVGSSGSTAGMSSFTGTAYRYGRPYRIEFVRIDGNAVAKKSAGPFLAMRAAAQRAGVYIRVVSGFRTMAEQQSLWRQYGPPRAAQPGYSPHQNGVAFDLNTAGFGGSVYNWLTRNAWRYGFKRTVSFEPWHWEYMR